MASFNVDQSVQERLHGSCALYSTLTSGVMFVVHGLCLHSNDRPDALATSKTLKYCQPALLQGCGLQASRIGQCWPARLAVRLCWLLDSSSARETENCSTFEVSGLHVQTSQHCLTQLHPMAGPGAKFFGALRNAICEITNTAKKAIKFTRFLGNGAQISACDDKSTKFDAQEIAQPQKLI
jgi:hypothetical protein